MSTAPVLQKVVPFEITIETGPELGRKFVFARAHLSIGRGSENDLVMADDLKMSRRHAEISLEDGVLCLRNLSQKNPMIFEGKQVESILLQYPAVVTIGETRMHFKPMAGAQADLVVPPRRTLASPHLAEASIPTDLRPRPQATRPAPAAKDSGANLFYIVLGGVVLVLLWLGTSEKTKQMRQNLLRTRSQVMMDIEKSESTVKDIEKKQEDAGQQTLQYKTAQEHYLKGFRDYRQGQYSRAMGSFQAALSFYPQHELARKYLLLSKRKFDEVVQASMIQGKRYKGKNNYRLCKSSYANAMIMIKEPNDPIYREAKQFYNECSLLMEGK